MNNLNITDSKIKLTSEALESYFATKYDHDLYFTVTNALRLLKIQQEEQKSKRFVFSIHNGSYFVGYEGSEQSVPVKAGNKVFALCHALVSNPNMPVSVLPWYKSGKSAGEVIRRCNHGSMFDTIKDVCEPLAYHLKSRISVSESTHLATYRKRPNDPDIAVRCGIVVQPSAWLYQPIKYISLIMRG